MKQWQEQLPTFNLILICIILVILLFTGFVLGPVNKLSYNNDEILKKLYSRYDIESCSKFNDYFIDKEMYVAKCTITDKEYYFFLDKNGIIYHKSLVDLEKEMNDYPILIDKYKLEDAEYLMVYYQDQLAYWIKSDTYEYVISYENYDVLMKVRY